MCGWPGQAPVTVGFVGRNKWLPEVPPQPAQLQFCYLHGWWWYHYFFSMGKIKEFCLLTIGLVPSDIYSDNSSCANNLLVSASQRDCALRDCWDCVIQVVAGRGILEQWQIFTQIWPKYISKAVVWFVFLFYLMSWTFWRVLLLRYKSSSKSQCSAEGIFSRLEAWLDTAAPALHAGYNKWFCLGSFNPTSAFFQLNSLTSFCNHKILFSSVFLVMVFAGSAWIFLLASLQIYVPFLEKLESRFLKQDPWGTEYISCPTAVRGWYRHWAFISCLTGDVTVMKKNNPFLNSFL